MISTTHAIMQKIACHGKVHAGNFPEDAMPALDTLYDAGHLVIMAEPAGDSWYYLSDEGKQHLIELNRSVNSSPAFESDAGQS